MLVGVRITHFGMLLDTQVGAAWEQIIRDGAAGRSETPDSALQSLVVLIGRNATGKSSFLGALSFLADCLKYDVPFAATLGSRGGFSQLVTAGKKPTIEISLIFRQNLPQPRYLLYQLQCAGDRHGRPYVRAEKVLSYDPEKKPEQPRTLLELVNGEGQVYEPKLERYVPAAVGDTKHPGLAVFGSIKSYPDLCTIYQQASRWYFCTYGRPAGEQPLQRSCGGHKHVNQACDNIENVLSFYSQEQPEYYRDMISRISEKLGDDVKQADQAFRNGDLTAGSLKFLAYLLLFEDPSPRPLICLEEPDVGLYHDMLEILGMEMRNYSLRHPDCQIIFSTHSPYMLESVRPEEIWVFRRKQTSMPAADNRFYTQTFCAGQSRLIQAMYQQGVGLGAIWYGGYFDQDPEA